PAGLPIGAPAPDFELPDLVGVRRKLSEFRGQDVLLIFFGPKCRFCTKMASDLAALPADGASGRPVPIVVTNGDADDNRKLVEQFGIRCVVLLQEQTEVAAQYQAQGTPMGYRIDAEGRIASELAVGAEPLLKLAGVQAPPRPAPSASGIGRVEKGKPHPSLARSRLNRAGLKAGTVGPEFKLPLLSGGELALSDLRGRRVLLVFSDPKCGPCDELAPRLQELHRSRPDIQVLVISRRDTKATRAKAEALGLTFPIVMQRQWEVSLQYGMFATPIGYLVDERGIIVKDVAVGVEPILALAEEPATTIARRDSHIQRNGAALAN
ncbi:MAG TPA: redoxin domain-containing protein, partial [Gemmataceae bacterium]|nr:redoxin domain-containing protein [Gemmataceae bacterium]